jgi:hypothetical protein
VDSGQYLVRSERRGNISVEEIPKARSLLTYGIVRKCKELKTLLSRCSKGGTGRVSNYEIYNSQNNMRGNGLVQEHEHVHPHFVSFQVNFWVAFG